VIVRREKEADEQAKHCARHEMQRTAEKTKKHSSALSSIAEAFSLSFINPQVPIEMPKTSKPPSPSGQREPGTSTSAP